MRIRQLSVGFNLSNRELNHTSQFAELERFFAAALDKFGQAGFEVRTTRGYSQTIEEMWRTGVLEGPPGNIPGLAKRIDALCTQYNITWFALPWGQLTRPQYEAEVTVEMLRNPRIFTSMSVCQDSKINFQAIECAAETMVLLSEDGGDDANFRFCAGANVNANGAFFPAAWHSGEPSFSLGLEFVENLVEIARQIVGHARIGKEYAGLQKFREYAIWQIDRLLEKIEIICKDLERQFGIKYEGIDLSLVPYPGRDTSVAHLVELILGRKFGSPGTEFVIKFLTNMLQGMRIKGIGFTGVMLSVTEDSVLAERNNEGRYSIGDLLSYSSLCGIGLDMLPIPPTTTKNDIFGLILDVAAKAAGLKPLIVRLLRQKNPNDQTDLNNPFLVNTRVMGVKKSGDIGCGLFDFTRDYIFVGRGMHRFRGLPGTYSYSNNPDLYDMVEQIPGEQMQYDTAADAVRVSCENKGKVVLLDFCCGTMAIEQRIGKVPQMSRIIGIDICNEYLEKTRKTFENDTRVQLILGDAVSAKLPAKGHVVIASSAYHHIGDLEPGQNRRNTPYDRKREYQRKVQFLRNLRDHLEDDGEIIFCENFIGHYQDEKEYSERVRRFYETRIRELFEDGIADERLELLREVMEFGIDRVYEWKVSMDIFRKHLEEAGLEIVDTKRVWPVKCGYFNDEQIGDFVIHAKKGGERK